MANQGLKGRVFQRSQGCWNCKGWDNGPRAKQYWEDSCKPRMLAQATEVALKAAAEGDLRGSKHPGVAQIVKTTQDAGKAIARGKFGLCVIGGAKSDFVEDAFLCEKWSGKTGASVARAGGAPDLLPEELRDKVDGSN